MTGSRPSSRLPQTTSRSTRAAARTARPGSSVRHDLRRPRRGRSGFDLMADALEAPWREQGRRRALRGDTERRGAPPHTRLRTLVRDAWGRASGETDRWQLALRPTHPASTDFSASYRFKTARRPRRSSLSPDGSGRTFPESREVRGAALRQRRGRTGDFRRSPIVQLPPAHVEKIATAVLERSKRGTNC